MWRGSECRVVPVGCPEVIVSVRKKQFFVVRYLIDISFAVPPIAPSGSTYWWDGEVSSTWAKVNSSAIVER